MKHATTKFYQIDFDKKEDYQAFCKECKGFDKEVVTIINKDDKKLGVFVSTNDKHINKVIDILSKYSIKEFSNKKETLEDYFMKFYKEDRDFGGAL